MKVYRAECEDGGGPFYKLDGTPRTSGISFKGNTELYGADSIENLKKLFTNYELDINNYKIVVYENVKIVSYNHKNGHIIFERSNS